MFKCNYFDIPKTILALILILSVQAFAEDDIDKLLGPAPADPFAQIGMPAPATAQITGAPQVIEEKKPELFIETVNLQFIEAQDLKPVIDAMVSKFGSASVDGKSNSIIVCDDVNNLGRILEQIKKIDQAHTQNVKVETVTLKFLDAKNLYEAVKSMSSKHGKIHYDERTNSLIVCDSTDNVARIVAEIRRADAMPPQILIEVVVVDVKLEDSTEIGVNWDSLFTDGQVNYEQSLVSDLTTSGITGGDFKILGGGITGLIHALQEKQDVEILASPKILVVSGQEAMIQTIEEIPYEEVSDSSDGGTTSLTSTQFKEVGVTLSVKATVTDSGKILLVVEPEQSVNTGQAGLDDRVPIIDKRLAKTTLLLDDGKTVAMGGLRKREITIGKDQIPVLGDIPGLGVLFSKNTRIINHSELLVLLCPHIYTGNEMTEHELNKFNEGRTLKPLQIQTNKHRPEFKIFEDNAPSYEDMKWPPQSDITWGDSNSAH